MNLRPRGRPPLPMRPLLFAGFVFTVITAQLANADDFSSTALRGFGTVSGSTATSTIDGQPGSVLTITCEDADPRQARACEISLPTSSACPASTSSR